MCFGKILRELRIERKMTQKQLATLLHVAEPTIRGWENQGLEPSYNILCQIANMFEVTVGQLLGVEEY